MPEAASWNLNWKQRPHEDATFFNPAFCGEMLFRAVKEHTEKVGYGLAFPLAFVVLPLVLHPATRAALPSKANTSLLTWGADNSTELALLPKRVIALRPVTRESLLFLSQRSVLAIGKEGIGLGSSSMKLSSKSLADTLESQDIRSSAGFLGRWFATQGSPEAILQVMGVRL